MRNEPKNKLIEIIQEYEQNLGDVDSKSSALNLEERERIKELVENFWTFYL